ncbi:MAG: hypothetical protein M3R35_04430 [Candidatus Eremiobacteraeota bacterium]|nr:hypothetical protein [Candidatus Eremiobacteraeota bacterium]
MADRDQIPLSEELLDVLRAAADISRESEEQFVTPRALLRALLDDPVVGPPLSASVDRSAIESVEPSAIDLSGVSRLSDDRIAGDEQPAMVPYDTLAFKSTDGSATLWLNKDAYGIFMVGANRAGDERYSPAHLARAFAAEAVRAPGLLVSIIPNPGALIDAMYNV